LFLGRELLKADGARMQ